MSHAVISVLTTNLQWVIIMSGDFLFRVGKLHHDWFNLIGVIMSGPQL